MATSLTLQNDASLAQGYVKVNGTTSATFTTSGLSTPQATIGSITGILKASSGVVSQAVAGTDYLTSSSGGAITLGTVQTTASGTAIDFTSIPSWAKRITVMFNSVTTNGTSSLLLQIGDAGGIQNTGYSGISGFMGAAGANHYPNITKGIPLAYSVMSAASAYSGSLTITKLNGNMWTIAGNLATTGLLYMLCFAGVKSLTNDLDRLRITTVSESPAFTGGTINISYE
jgi:hypothetical protein